MPVYEFRCEAGHAYDKHLAITSSVSDDVCPSCSAPARRRISSPAMVGGSSSARRLIESTQATAEKPMVVDSLPSSPGRRPTPVSHDPRHAALPRP